MFLTLSLVELSTAKPDAAHFTVSVTAAEKL